MREVEVWLVRHGQTDHNAQGKLSGWTEVSLTDLGRDQARKLIKYIEKESFEHVWSSDLGRAKETARLAWGKPVTIDNRLREIHFGELEGVDFYSLDKNIQSNLLDFKDFYSPGGESIEQLEKRVTEFMDSLAPGRHLLFTHGGVIRCVMHLLTETQRFVPNGSLVIINWSKKRLISVHESESTPNP